MVRSKDVIFCNLDWLLTSGIRIKNDLDKGALYGWKYLNPPSYPFVYSEITGYAITCYSWIHVEFSKPEALCAAQEAADWVMRRMNSNYLLVAGHVKQENFAEKGNMSNQIYLFDNTMAMIGLLNLHKLSGESHLLQYATKMADSLINYFFEDSKISEALLDGFHKPSQKDRKWSTEPGAYHSKLSLGFLNLSKLTGNENYSKISDTVSDFAMSLQKPDGRFETGPATGITFLHPHLYACEGLVYSGIYQSKERYLKSGLKGLVWAVDQLNDRGGLPRDNSGASQEQSDAMCQLLRLLVMCHSELKKFMDESSLNDVITKLHDRILDFCIVDGKEDLGGVKYHLGLDTACTWCTMFCLQALRLWQRWEQKGMVKDNLMWIDYFV